MPVLETIENVQDQVLETIGSVQNRVIETNKKLAGQLNETLGDRFDDIVDRMPALPLVDAVTDRIPAPSVAVNTYFDLVERATKANRKFAQDLVGAWVPAKKSTTAKKPVAKKPVAKKRAVAKNAAAKKPATKKTVAAKKAVASNVSADTKA